MGFLGQFFEGIRLDDYAFFHQLLKFVFAMMVFELFAGTLLETRCLFLPFGIKDGPMGKPHLLTGLITDIGKGQVLVGITFTALVDGQPRLTGNSVHTAAGIALRVKQRIIKEHGCMRAFINAGTNPEPHLLAVASVEGVRVHDFLHLRRCRNIIAQHFLIVAVVTGAEDNTFLRQELDILAVLVLGDYALYPALIIRTNQLYARRFVEYFTTQLFGRSL